MPEDLPEQSPSENPQKEKKKSKKIWLILAVVIILLLALGFLAYLFLPASDSETDTAETTETPAATEAADIATSSAETEETTEEFECSAQVYENSEQGYKVCYGEGWVNREFDTSAITVGFDPTNIPEASEYFGLIVVSVSGSDMDSSVSEIEESLEGSSTTTVSVDGESATQISGTEPDSLIRSGGPVIKTLFTHFDRLYIVTLDSNTTENKAFYDAFLASWRFLDSAASPAP